MKYSDFYRKNHLKLSKKLIGEIVFKEFGDVEIQVPLEDIKDFYSAALKSDSLRFDEKRFLMSGLDLVEKLESASNEVFSLKAFIANKIRTISENTDTEMPRWTPMTVCCTTTDPSARSRDFHWDWGTVKAEFCPENIKQFLVANAVKLAEGGTDYTVTITEDEKSTVFSTQKPKNSAFSNPVIPQDAETFGALLKEQGIETKPFVQIKQLETKPEPKPAPAPVEVVEQSQGTVSANVIEHDPETVQAVGSEVGAEIEVVSTNVELDAEASERRPYHRIGERHEFSIYVARKYMSMHESARKRGLDLTLELSELMDMLKTPVCHYTGEELVYFRHDPRKVISGEIELPDNYLTVDRKDNTKGYVSGNVVLCGRNINQLKDQMDEASFVQIVAVKKLMSQLTPEQQAVLSQMQQPI
ncbi:hypothetical protein [Vibrio crassostreae]|uniref:hypothetical protein n=1 Tax=Vibrio crassostreae TaxID=246167 RepID=UPI001B30D3C4|nr:hypothetical protein [Vibrio crassostreae]